ncbi:MAG: hypothetical protein U9R32_01945, partial [Bacteroidota bacterium]|nr:hypothetical protein [Bacteroidota bacterium]
IEQQIKITGTVVHICEHGGKRMFIIGDNPEKRIRITADKNVSSFKAELEGSDVTITGIIKEKKIDEAFLTNWETEVKSNRGEELEGEHKIHTGGLDHDKQDGHGNSRELKQISNFRQQIKESKKGYFSLFSIECNKYTENK